MAGIINGQTPDADEVLAMSNIRQIYTGSGFDSTISGNGTDEQSFELDAIASAINSNYAEIIINGIGKAKPNDQSALNTKAELKVQIKETGQSYADVIVYKIVVSGTISSSGNQGQIVVGATNTFYALLTSGMKTNGFQIKIFSKSSSGDAANSASFDNVQTVLGVRT